MGVDDGEVAGVRWTYFVTSFMENNIPSVHVMRRTALLYLDPLNIPVWKN